MSKKIMYHANGNKKKEVLDMIKNGYDFRLIINYNSNGNVNSVMEKPNQQKLDPCILISGAHVFSDPRHNHCDFFQSGALVLKEYPKIRGSTDYGYTISGARVII